MDNKKYFRDEDEDSRDDEEFYGIHYEDFKSAHREVIYTFNDITIERPSWKDFKHILKCNIKDAGLSYDEFLNSGQNLRREHLVKHVYWFFSGVDNDDIFIFYKNNEYAGFATIEPGVVGVSPPIATEIIVRNKFKKTLVFLASIDCALNLLYVDTGLIIEQTDIPEFDNLTTALNLGPYKFKMFTQEARYRVNRLIKKLAK